MKIEQVTRDTLVYVDDNDKRWSVDLHACNKNWIEQNNSEDDLSPLDLKYIGFRNVCGKPPYILLFTEPETKLEFRFDSECNVTDEQFWNLLDLLRKVGWRTIDLS